MNNDSHCIFEGRISTFALSAKPLSMKFMQKLFLFHSLTDVYIRCMVRTNDILKGISPFKALFIAINPTHNQTLCNLSYIPGKLLTFHQQMVKEFILPEVRKTK